MTRRRVRIVLQARTTSRRLPGKVLLPIAGLPLALLCARRLGLLGADVVLATSYERTDDVLAALAVDHGIRVFRGDLHDVLGRFLGCTGDLAATDLVVRATADNPVPDGEFVEQLVAEFDRIGDRYLACSSPEDGLPYGLAAEVCSAGALRESASRSSNPYAREHVTVTLARDVGAVGIVRPGLFLDEDCSRLRVTIDTLDDYLAMATVFREFVNPESVSWLQIVDRLRRHSRASGPAAL